MVGEHISYYKILKKIAGGGMGEVYLARDTKLHRKVVLKFLLPQYTSDPVIVERFKREARAAATLNHPNIITVYEISEFEKRSFIAMEYVKGGSLSDLISQGNLPLDKAINISIQICKGLCEAHRAGIVHRDIKPANILINEEEQVKIVDFGLAKLKSVSQLTQPGTTLGTPTYMSPEQIQGKGLDFRSDIFSVGVVFYELITGQAPFKGDQDLTLMYAIATAKPTPISHYKPHISDGLQWIIDKALEKDPSKRYQNIDNLLEGLEKEKRISAEPSYQNRSITLKNVKPWTNIAQRKKKLIASISGAALILIFLGLFLMPGLRQRALNIFRDSQQKEISKTTPLDKGAKPEKLPVNVGGVRLTSVPVGASVWLNGKRVGRTPYVDNTLKTGKYNLEFRRDGYQKYAHTFAVRRGEMLPINAKLIALFGELQVTSAPKEALILLDGKQIGTTPQNIQEVEPGEHTIVLQKKGFKDYSTSVTVEPAKVSRVNGKFTALTGSLNVLVRPRGSIYIDGDLKKRDTNVQYKIDLPVGTHQVKAVHPTLGTWEKKVEIEPDRLQQIPIDFNKYVTLTVLSIDPSGKAVSGEIYIDNNFTGQTTPKQLKVRIGKHSIEVQREGYVLDDGEKVFNLEDDVREPLIFTLRKRPGDDKLPVFAAYDEPPEIIGGSAEINKYLRYPPIARKAGVEGIVFVSVIVGLDGKTESVEIIKAEPANLGFEDSAIQAIKKVRWKPAKQRDKEVRAQVNIPINFNLHAIR